MAASLVMGLGPQQTAKHAQICIAHVCIYVTIYFLHSSYIAHGKFH